MKQELFDLYNSLKNTFIEKIVETIDTKQKTFSPYIRVNLPRDTEEMFEEIVSIEYDEKENTWYAHNYITDTNLDVTEYWTPLRDLSFDELFKIAEAL